MSITKTIFTGADGPALAAETAVWLKENATEYFDSVELDQNGYEVVCKIGQTTVADLKFSNGSANANFDTCLLNGVKRTWNNARNITGAYKTSKGIFLFTNYSDGNYQPVTDPSTGEAETAYNGSYGLFIVKSDNDNTAFVNSDGGSSAGTCGYVMADLSADSKWALTSNINSIFSVNSIFKRPKTVLCPVPLGDGGTTADGLFFTPFTQYKGFSSPTVITVNGKDYVYDGAFALEE